jgi:hypothetical protein
MNKQYFRNDYCIIVYTNIQGVFEDYDLYLIDQQTGRRKYHSSYYDIKSLLFSLKEIYNTIKEVKEYA